MSTVAVPVDGSAQSAPGRPDPALNVPGRNDSDELVLTARQRAYLDALGGAGVHPSSELLALSIGTYVCQARAAGQSDQAVWDFVVPLVRGDVHDAHPMPRSDSSIATMAARVDQATDGYIRVATEQLC